MKIKKILSLILAIAMIGSLITVSVSADGEDIILSMSESTEDYISGNTFTLSLMANIPQEKAIAGFGVEITVPDGLELTEVTKVGILAADGASITVNVAGKKIVGYFETDQHTNGVAEEISKLTFTVGEVSASGGVVISVAGTNDMANGSGASLTTATATTTVNLVKTFAVASDVTDTLDVEYGTTADAIKTALSAEGKTFAVAGANEGESANLNAADWTSDDYPVDELTAVIGDDTTYTFVGNLVSKMSGDVKIVDANDKKVTVTVTVKPITEGYTVPATAEGEIKAEKVERTVEDSEIIAKLPTTVEITKGNAKDVVTVPWNTGTVTKTDLDITDTTTSATVVVTLPTTSDNGKFTIDADTTITGTVKIVPATVAGATLKNNNKSINAVPSVTITVPASAVEEDTPATDTTEAVGNNTVVVTIKAKGLDTPIEIITKSDVKKSELVDENGASIAYTITGEESYRSLGLTSATDIVITATLNGAALAGTPAEEGAEAPVLSETDTVKKPKSSGGPSYISPSGSSSNGNDQTGSTGSTDTTTPDDTDKPVVDTPVVEAPFDDVAGDHWAAEAIATLKDAGIVGGVTATTFAPDADITRAEFTKMVVGLLKLEAASTEVAFEDCGAEDWYTPYVAAAVEAGLVTGVSETEFAPNATITREQAFAIIGRAVAGVEANTTLAYTDAAEVSEYAVPYVTILTQMGIVEGFGEGTVRPQANITRAEAAKVIAGLMANVVTEEEVAEDNAEKATEEVAEEAKEDAAEETTEETTETEAADKTAEEDVAEETAEDAADKTTEE